MNLRRVPVGGWAKCVHEAASFESRGEYAAACAIDQSEDVQWWLRNDPPVVRIPTPVGYFEPDFVYCRERAGVLIHGALEVKGGIFWNGPGSVPRVKAAAACEWARAVASGDAVHPWEFAEVIDEDALTCEVLDDLIGRAVERWAPA